MSQTVIFSVGFLVFALTVWGAIMAGGIWMGQLAASEDERSVPRSGFTERGSDEVDGTPRTTFQ
ncbi:MAG: hypothetical protein ABI658_22020 [Acidimicrobiales bacterium]